jgi:hypothetical protein
LGFRVCGLGFRVWGLGWSDPARSTRFNLEVSMAPSPSPPPKSRVQVYDLEVGAWGSGLSSFGFRVRSLRFGVLMWVQGAGCRVRGSTIEGVWFRPQLQGFRV